MTGCSFQTAKLAHGTELAGFIWMPVQGISLKKRNEASSQHLRVRSGLAVRRNPLKGIEREEASTSIGRSLQTPRRSTLASSIVIINLPTEPGALENVHKLDLLEIPTKTIYIIRLT